MSFEVFTAPWAAAFAEALRTDENYRKTAATWEGSLLFEMAGSDDDAGPAVFLDLWHGDCRDARLATEEDRTGADFAIRATPESWQRVLAGELEPIFAIMSGKLKLTRGSLTKLVPYTQASKALVAAAASLGGTFPQ